MEDLLDGLKNSIRYGVEKERAVMSDNGLNESPGLWNSMWGSFSGASDEGVERKRSAMKSAQAEIDYKERFERVTGKPWKKGTSAGSALEQIDTALETKADSKFQKQLALQTQAGMAPITAQLEATREENTANRQFESRKFDYLEKKDANRYDLARAQHLDDKAEARRERLDMLDRQDHRYDQQMERYDKRRRQESIQGLVGGLAALGAAFAI